MKRKMLGRLLSIVMIGMLLLSGCSSNVADAESSSELTSIKISTINAISWSPMFIAESEGFFKEQGLKVEFVTPGGPKGFQATHAGEADFCMLSQEPLLIAQEQGIRSTIIATMLESRVYGIIAAPEITEISQLKGATVYGGDPGSAPYTFSSSVYEQAGLDPQKDVTFMQMDANAAIMALEKGEIKAAFMNMFKMPELKGMDVNILVDATQEEDCLKYLGTKEFPAEMLCATETYVKENPETVQKVVNAVLDAQNWIQNNTDEAVAKSLSTAFTGLDMDVLAAEVAIMRPVLSQSGYISEVGQKAVIDMCLTSGLIEEDIPYEEVVDMTFVNNYKK